MSAMKRREFLGVSALAAYPLLRFGLTNEVFAGEVRPIVETWFRELVSMCRDLRRFRLTGPEWQARIDDLYKQISLEELIRWIDVERLLDGIELPDDHAAIRQVRFPKVEGIPKSLGFGHKLFALKRGRAVVPHAHNNMVSAHLVLSGAFHVRTFNRRFDLERERGFLYIEPSMDTHFSPGDLLTMSDERDNIHWLVAESDMAVTFDIPVTDLDSTKTYATEANRYSMIFVDPTEHHAGNDAIRAKILSVDQALARFGKRKG